MNTHKTVKVDVLRTFDAGSVYFKKGTVNVEIPESLARELAKGKNPAVVIRETKKG